jgi:radical SAM protein with 4Fe4S-binding SPASM domain
MQNQAEIRALINTKRIDLGAMAPLAAPLIMYVETSGFCNLRCKFCPHYTDPDGLTKDNMSFELFEKLVVDMKRFPEKVELLRYCGTGENLLNKKFPEMARLAKQAGVAKRQELITNGLLLTPEIAKQIAPSLDRIIISLEGLNDQDYFDVAGMRVTKNASYANLVENISELYKVRGTCQVHIKCHNHAVDTDEKLALFYDTFRPIADVVFVENLASIWPEVPAEQSNLGIDAGTRWQTKAVSKNVCVQIFKSMLVNANGEVVPCCVDFKRVNKIGDIRNESIVDIWFGKKMKALQERHLCGLKGQTKPCADCTMNDFGDPDYIDDQADQVLSRLRKITADATSEILIVG